MLPENILARVGEYYMKRVNPKDFDSMMVNFFGIREGDSIQESWMPFFIEWFTFEYLLPSGRNLVEDYYYTNPANLKFEQLEYYKCLKDNIYSVFKINSIDKGRGFEAIDMQTDIRYYVREVSATYEMEVEDCMFGRISNIFDHYELIGANTLRLQEEECKQFIMLAEKIGRKIDVKFFFQFVYKMIFDCMPNMLLDPLESLENPRNDLDTVLAFEPLIFFNDEEFSRIRTTEEDILFLKEAGFLNLIFRYYMEITLIKHEWSEHFQGCTPKQELSIIYPGVRQGGYHLSVSFKESEKGWYVSPSVYSKDIKKGDDLFVTRMKSLKGNKDDGFNSVDFQMFFNRLTKKDIVPQGNITIEDFKSFWEDAVYLMVSGIPTKNNSIEFKKKISVKLKKAIEKYFRKQGKGNDDYLSTDELFKSLWGVYMKEDSSLLDYESILSIDIEEDMLSHYSISVFYNLGVKFDQHILFPIDEYFGYAECVFTDKKRFLETISMLHAALKHHVKIKNREKSLKEFREVVEDSFYCPCTSFRFTGVAYDYFHR
ncbi:MAG: hypothetical protein MNSN_06330 [Minisyncoccus archaeiphilus]|nr:MAG: hypothetical protein MNSN_06330 [Candidatus Parcubacteria bacterium]